MGNRDGRHRGGPARGVHGLDRVCGRARVDGRLMRVRLDLAYVGTRYAGWQRQSRAPSVQQTLELALSRLYNRRITIAGAGRTDAGVHAAGQVAHFDVESARPAVKDLPWILSRMLPPDIAVLRARKVSPVFHARRRATWRTYQYRILTSKIPDPFRGPYVWHVPWADKLDLVRMRRAARGWLGTKDFAAFAICVPKGRRTRRHMRKIVLRRAGDELRLTFV